MRKEELVKALTTSNIPGLSNLTFKVLKAIAQEHGVNVTSKTTEAELVDALKNIDIFLDNLRNTERKYLAKVRGIRGYNKMRREELIKALSAFIPEVKLPIPEVRTPHSKLSFTSLKRLVKKVEDSVVTDVDKFTEWVLEQIPDPVKKRATHKVNALNKKVKGLFKEIERFKPRELESAFNIFFLNTYRIEGQRRYDPKNFFDESELRVLGLLAEKEKPIKTHFLFNNGFTRIDPATGEVEEMTHYFHGDVIEIYETINIVEKYREMRDLILEKIATFQPQKSGWQFDQILSHDISIVPFRPLAGNSYIPTPKKIIGYRKAIVNVQNKSDNECFKWAVTSAVYPQNTTNPERLSTTQREL